ncbi:MAG: hypothetical protein Q9157_003403 [Trypethelium eluteriae]
MVNTLVKMFRSVSITEKATSFPIMRLPVELRLMIYRFVLFRGRDGAGCEDVEIRLLRTSSSKEDSVLRVVSIWPQFIWKHPFERGCWGDGLVSQFIDFERGVRPNVALLRVSRAVYKEAMPVLYGENRFQFPEYYTRWDRDHWLPAHHAFNKFLLEIGPEASAHIRKLTIPMLKTPHLDFLRIIKRHRLCMLDLRVVATKRIDGHPPFECYFAPMEEREYWRLFMNLRGCRTFSFPQPGEKVGRTTFGRSPVELFLDNEPIADEIRTQLKIRSGRRRDSVDGR